MGTLISDGPFLGPYRILVQHESYSVIMIATAFLSAVGPTVRVHYRVIGNRKSPRCRWPILAELAPFFETPEWTRNWISGLGEIVSATFTTAITILLGFFVLACGMMLVTHPSNNLRLALPKEGGTVPHDEPPGIYRSAPALGPYGEFTPASELRNAGNAAKPAAGPLRSRPR